jgi:hypothetical protein
MGAFGKEMPQPLCRLRDRVRAGDADAVEAVLARRAYERRFKRRRIVQKSRSA